MQFSQLARRVAKMAIGCVAAAALCVGTAQVGFAASGASSSDESISLQAYGGYSDVNKRDWYVESGDFDYVIERGLMSGYGNGLFGPYDTVTRGQVMTILHRMAGEPEADSTPFRDVDYGEYYGPAIRWARAARVASGYGDTNTFGPNDPVTREQFAVMLTNYARNVAKVRVQTDGSALNKIAESNRVSSWAREAMGWAVDMEILGGVDIGGVDYVRPQDIAQRCQVAKMIAVLHRDVGARWAGKHVVQFESPEGTFSSAHHCLAGRDNPLIFDVKEIDPVTKILRCDITCLIHAHYDPDNNVDSCNGDAVATIRDIQVDYSTAFTPSTRSMYQGSKDDLLVKDGTCNIKGTFSKTGLFKIQVGSVYFPNGEGAGYGFYDTYEIQL